MIAFVFGCFKLSTRQLLWLSLLTVIAYAATLPLIKQVEGPGFNLPIELSLWLTFSLFLPSLSLLAGNISRMRSQLATNNASLQAALHKVTELATLDELTGAYNRRYLMNMLEYAKGRSDRDGGSFCLCLIDLDFFKQLNDACGHLAGDAVLKGVSDTFNRMLRSTDIFARYGGDEFILMLPQTSLETAQLCTARIRRELGTLRVEGVPDDFRITISIGIAQYRIPENISSLLERADSALYQAKNGGRDRVETEELHSPNRSPQTAALHGDALPEMTPHR
jgi:diguanylate cyclase